MTYQEFNNWLNKAKTRLSSVRHMGTIREGVRLVLGVQ